jgi:OPA family glycerol-3-phosphate transporter-like MFS transporter 1/2
MFSTMFEIGGIVGSASIGYVLGRFFNNKSLLGSTVETFLSALGLIVFIATSEMGIFINSFIMIIIGIYIIIIIIFIIYTKFLTHKFINLSNS